MKPGEMYKKPSYQQDDSFEDKFRVYAHIKNLKA